MSDLVASPVQEPLVMAEASLASTSSSKGRTRKRKGEESEPATESVAKKVGFVTIYATQHHSKLTR